MKKLLYLLICINLYANISIPKDKHQLILVVSNDFNATTALLQAYEKKDALWIKVFKPIPVNLGRNGLAWARKAQAHFYEPLKYEGDGKAPAGIFNLTSFFGYAEQDFDFKYLRVSNNDICVDDSSSKDYNTLVKTNTLSVYQSFEFMKRDDNLYELGVVVQYNKQAIKQRGSCIFLHVQRDINSPTSGCTSMSKPHLLKLMKWLDAAKNPILIQVPKKYIPNL